MAEPGSLHGTSSTAPSPGGGAVALGVHPAFGRRAEVVVLPGWDEVGEWLRATLAAGRPLRVEVLAGPPAKDPHPI